MSRSLWKPQYIDKKILDPEKKTLIMASRHTVVTKDFMGFSVKIYNGIRFYDLIVTEKMLGRKFGEFAPTRKIPKHKKKKK